MNLFVSLEYRSINGPSVATRRQSVDRFARERIIIQNKEETRMNSQQTKPKKKYSIIYNKTMRTRKQKIKSTHWNVLCAQYVCMIRYSWIWYSNKTAVNYIINNYMVLFSIQVR